MKERLGRSARAARVRVADDLTLPPNEMENSLESDILSGASDTNGDILALKSPACGWRYATSTAGFTSWA